MSDPLLNQIAEYRKKLTETLNKEAKKIPLIEKFQGVAKEMGIPTDDLDKLLDISKAVFKGAGIKIPKPTEKES